ncbi:M23 family metallopeptidase [Paenibacillus sp. KN14-4R]|uniref:M23 family metallopeptidase n=1 Tax=Paenibacillus sp. KN14-4R TaxID=3445773 RepID=UPI003FA017CD
MNPRKKRHSSTPYPRKRFVFTMIGLIIVGAIGGLTYRLSLTANVDQRAVSLGMTEQVANRQRVEQEEMEDNWQAFMEKERAQLKTSAKEAAYYTNTRIAKDAMEANWTLIPAKAAPGDVILVRHQEPAELTWQDKKYKLLSFGTGYYTYVPIPITMKAGKYPIGDQFLTITDKKFETQRIQVTKQMESMRQDTGRIEADQKKINLARSKSSPAFLFTSNFMQPIEGVLTTPFGYTRYVNDKLDSRHTAIDLAAPEGTEIHATNDGVVALADSLYLTGNSIYLDHGMNLFSQYAHLSKLLVKAGDRVKRGDVIGLVGTTGFSTGPHLHFTFWANNTPVNPNLFFGTTPFHWLEQGAP